MCSICGGTVWNGLAEAIWERSKDRGRDDHGKAFSPVSSSWIGNHRAVPTTEEQYPIEKQPVGGVVKIVFNGIISNDKDLGVRLGEADTSVLPRVLDFHSLPFFRKSVSSKLIGSYAIAAMLPSGEIWLAANYKPIWVARYEGQWYFSSLRSHFPKPLLPQRMLPYSVRRLNDPFYSLNIPRKQAKKAVVIASSGLDSTAVASFVCRKHSPRNTTLIHFDYGCRAGEMEKRAIGKIRNYLGCQLEIIPLPSFGGSPLLDGSVGISQGKAGAEFAHEWVPARNLLMLSTAVAFAEAKGAGHIYLGTNLEEAGAYPDNEEQFILDFENLLYGAVQNGVKIQVHSPLGGLMKHEIIPFGNKYDTPFHLTWSCYQGGEVHCGNCGPCFMRKIAFERNGMKDPVMPEKI